MKTILPFMITFFAAKTFAVTLACGLPAEYNKGNYVDVSALEQIYGKEVYTDVQFLQVMKTAKHENKVKKTNMQIISFDQAIQYLVDYSRWGNAYVFESKTASGHFLDVVMYYPNSKPHGAMFNKGQTKPVAWVADSVVTCAN
jgi:hypothetical protein